MIGQYFDCDRATGHNIIAEINGTHPAFADTTEKTISSDITQTRVGSINARDSQPGISCPPVLRPDPLRGKARSPNNGLLCIRANDYTLYNAILQASSPLNDVPARILFLPDGTLDRSGLESQG